MNTVADTDIWLAAERDLTTRRSPESSRTSGLLSARMNKWPGALLRLSEAAYGGCHDLQTLDELGEAAYRTRTPEALAPFQALYTHPSLATHMMRAFLMLGDAASAREYGDYAAPSALRDGLFAMLNMSADIKSTIDAVLPVARHAELYYPEYWRALAAVADAAGNTDLVRLAEQRSKQHAYDDPNVHFNQALRYLAKGEFRAGWRLYDWRLMPGVPHPPRTHLADFSMWEGEDLVGKTLLVWMEQGLGDIFFGLRYIAVLQAQGAQVELVSSAPTLALIRSSFPGVPVHDDKDAVNLAYWVDKYRPDFWTYCLSIPLRAACYEPVGMAGYLVAPDEYVARYRAEVEAANPRGMPVRGLVWHGLVATASDRTRAFTVAEFAGVSGILAEPTLVVSLQKDATEDEVAELRHLVEAAGGVLIDAAPTLVDFAHTAGWMRACDRVLTCDTSSAHVAGGLGVPTTVLARNKAIWQWLRRDDGQSVWYDSIRVEHALAPEISWMFTVPPEPAAPAKPDMSTSGHPSGFNFAGE